MHNLEMLESRRLLSFGDLDATFGDGGNVAPLSLTEYVFPHKTIVQSDGRILVAGWYSTDWALRRYLPDGSVDAGFGDGGIFKLGALMRSSDAVEFLAETADGKIFVGGNGTLEDETFTGDTAATMLIARLNFDGTLDETFLPGAASNVGRAGFVRVGALPAGYTEFRKQLVKVVREGKLLVATGDDPSDGDDPSQMTLSRYNPNGQLDKSFGVGGRVRGVSLAIPTETVAPPGKRSMSFRGATGLRALAEAPDGSVIGMGYYTYARGTAQIDDPTPYTAAYIPYFVRVSADGQVLATHVHALDINKAQTQRYSGLSVIPFGMAVAPDGKIYVVGERQLVRFNADFSLDPTFDVDGIVAPSAVANGTAFLATLADVKVQADRKVVGVVRDIRNSIDVEDPILVRFNEDGSTETSVQLAVPPDATPSPAVYLLHRTLNQVALAPDGTILVAGEHFPLTRVFRDEGPAGRFEGGSVTNAGADRIYKFGITWRDDDGIDLDSLDNGDLEILTPAGGRMVARILSRTPQDGGAVLIRYRTGPTNGISWTNADNGRYVVRLISNRVRDIGGAAALGRVIGTFDVRVT